MRQVFDRIIYDTDKATLIGPVGTLTVSDFDSWSCNLYRTQNGRYFIAGSGGARSIYARERDGGGHSGGSGIIPLSAEDALHYAEASDDIDVETIEEYFAEFLTTA